MGSYAPILYTNPLNPDCARVRRALRQAGVRVETRNVLASRRHRGELRRLLDGAVRVPCLALPDSVITEREAIVRYLRLRYGVAS